ncbi:beta-lactamase family protein [Cellulomonas sp. DKR-3]|uniref:Beta-lactamase family protein n=2 Tax=Cellulomonas fulva TaxID=2835530 RepID=A0ABS5TWM4_9CELL|nr:beta-lactamase family protein [Cellulomonas fulva]
MLLTGTGYAAHNACAVTTVAGRDDPADDLPDNPLVPVLKVATSEESASASVLGLLARQKAWSTPGFGCTLADERPDLPEPTAVTANALTDAPAPVADPAVQAALDAAFGTDLDDEARAALGTRAVVVLHDGELVAEQYADGFDATTPQLGWSMTKSVANLVVGRLVQAGDVSLDDDHLRPQWTDVRADITVRDLLGMTSGLAWDETYELGTPITRMLYDEPDMGAFVASQEPAHEPGTYLQYSSGSTTLLCAILAEDHGGANLVRDQVFAPLGLSSAVLEPDAAGTPVCSSYQWATARDWATIGQLALQDGVWEGERLLPEGWMRESTTAVDVAETEEQGYALGWWVNTMPDGSLVHPELPADAYFAEGHDGQSITIVPSRGLVVVRLGFTPEADDRATALAAHLVGIVDATPTLE